MLTYQKILAIIAFNLLLLPTLALAQDAVYDGQVINKVSELPVPNVSVILLKEKAGTQTNEQGYFRLISAQKMPQDTLIFTSVGYRSFKLAAADHQPQMFIALEPTNTQLGQVTITDKKIKTVTLEKFSWSDIKDVHNTTRNYSTIAFSFGTWYAKLFEAPQDNVVLASIQLGRRDLEVPDEDGYVLATTNKNTRFLIHVLTVEPNTGYPGEDIFTREVSLTDNSLFVTVDLSKDKLVIPATKFFIGLEKLKIPYNEVIKLDHAPKAERLKKNGEQLLMDASQYRVEYQPFLIAFPKNEAAGKSPLIAVGNMVWGYKDPSGSSKAGMARSFVKIQGKWMPVDTNYETALSATIHY